MRVFVESWEGCECCCGPTIVLPNGLRLTIRNHDEAWLGKYLVGHYINVLFMGYLAEAKSAEEARKQYIQEQVEKGLMQMTWGIEPQYFRFKGNYISSYEIGEQWMYSATYPTVSGFRWVETHQPAIQTEHAIMLLWLDEDDNSFVDGEQVEVSILDDVWAIAAFSCGCGAKYPTS